MGEYTKTSENISRTLDSNPKASKQGSISEILQAYKNGTLQRMSVDEEELLQAKARDKSSERETLQRYTEYAHRDRSGYNALIQGVFGTPQRKGIEDDELLQGKFDSSSATSESTVQREVKPNNTGLPDNLKSGIENLSGYSMDDVKVHYNSDKPAQLSALAYAQGTDIHVAPGQEKHLPHEAWHVVQQKQGRVQPTMQLQGVNINDDEGLEREADDALQFKMSNNVYSNTSTVIQRKIGFEFQTGWNIEKNNWFFNERLPKGEKWLPGSNFNVEADDGSTPDESQIEFVTDPLNSLAEVTKTLKLVKTAAHELIQESKGKSFKKEISGQSYKISPSDNYMEAIPQASFGIQTDRLFSMIKFHIDANLKQQKSGFNINDLKDLMKISKIEPMENIGSLSLLINLYITIGKDRECDYPKQITDGFILARTDFVKLLSLAVLKDGRSLIPDKPNYFSMDEWMYLFKGEYESGQRLFGKEVKSDKDKEPFAPEEKIYAKDLTIEELLMSIYTRAQVLDMGCSKPDPLTTVKDHESLGALKKRTETVAGVEAGIFESRLHSPRNIPYTKWEEYAIEWAEFIVKMTGADKNDFAAPVSVNHYEGDRNGWDCEPPE